MFECVGSDRFLFHFFDVFFDSAGGEGAKGLLAVIGGGFIFSDMSAFFALLGQDVVRPLYFQIYGIHDAVAIRCSIPGININVLAGQAKRAMVGIAVSFDGISTNVANKILF